MRITQLDKKIHDRKDFDCGEDALNNYLKSVAGQHDEKSLARTFVITSKVNESKILGFYSLALCQVDLSELPDAIAKKYPGPIFCTLIGRLAVTGKSQGEGLGPLLLVDAVKKAVESSYDVPKPMIVVDAKNDKARNFYLKFGFIELPSQKYKLYMPQKAAKKMLIDAGIISE